MVDKENDSNDFLMNAKIRPWGLVYNPFPTNVSFIMFVYEKHIKKYNFLQIFSSSAQTTSHILTNNSLLNSHHTKQHVFFIKIYARGIILKNVQTQLQFWPNNPHK